MSKDTIKVNMNVYDIPILVEQLKKLEKENKQLKEDKKKAREYIKEKARNNCWIDQYETNELIKILGDKEQ